MTNQEAFDSLVKQYYEDNRSQRLPWETIVERFCSSNQVYVKANDVINYYEQNGYEGILSNIYGFDINALKTTPKGQLVIEFYHHLPEWFLHNGSDCCICYGYGDERKSNVKSRFGVSRGETLLFERDTSFWSNDNQGLVITDQAIHVVPDNEDASRNFLLEWQDIEQVDYQETVFYFKMHDGHEASIPWGMFYKGSFPGTKLCQNLANVLTALAKIIDAVPDATELFDDGKYDDALSSCDNLIASNDAGERLKGHFLKGFMLYRIEDDKENADDIDQSKLAQAQKELETAYKLATDDSDKAEIQYFLAKIKLSRNDISARDSFILGMEAEDNDTKEEAYESLQAMEGSDYVKEIWDSYVNDRPYKERKFIMPVNDRDIAGCVTDGITVFRMSNIPSCIKFPIGHPVANQLYIGHPYNPQLYVPYEESEDLFFADKVHELCYLLECLGAEEIDITSVKGKSVDEMNSISGSVSGSADVKIFSGEGNFAQASSVQNQSNDLKQRTMKMVLDPSVKPYVPDGLIWYEEQPQWKRLVQSRLHGNLLEYNEYVTSSSTRFVSSSEKKDITASAKYLWIKVHADADSETSSQLKDTEDTQWRVEVRFRSTDLLIDPDGSKKDVSIPSKQETLSNNQQLSLNGNEAKYLDEVKFCIEDSGEIGATERKFLERLRKRYDISEERAIEIEEMANTRLSDEEKEYLDAVKDVLADGEMSEHDKKLLNRLRSSLDITEERAIELERMA